MTASAPAMTRSPRLDSLTGVRFFAALIVFGFHSLHYVSGLELFGAGMVGVSLFYILSGFVMAWTARDDDLPSLFYRRRFARIYPAFITAWVASLALLVSSGSLTSWDFLSPTLLQAWVPVEAAYFAGSAVFWSLSCEAFFYLMFPLIHKFMRGLSTAGIVAVACSAGAVSIGTALATIGVAESDFTRWFLIIFPPLRLMEFVVGVALGMLFRRGFRLPVPLWAAVGLAVLSIFLAAYAPYSVSRYAVTLIPFVILVAALATADLQGRVSLFRWKPLVMLGVWSYCFYLLHAMVLSASFRASRLFEIDAPWVVLGGALLLSIGAAWLLHVVVEAPFERRLRPSKVPRLDSDASPSAMAASDQA
ncbi:acyltransferase family protein [Pseudoclavibacter terrae]|uniref:Acyltransferase n=1 Tax=Pseudoclavibacter terrae TaxID=1530195 RepID=A0A7J5B4L9_9MICO|nr:acyltransferase [Pseudoclavibacter terrae]KAB1639125.1 acyltransferase [Pseudoclavibacter terrae]